MAYEVKGDHPVVIYPTADQTRLSQLFSELTGVPEQVTQKTLVRHGLDAILDDPSILGVSMELELKVRNLRDLIRAMGGVGV